MDILWLTLHFVKWIELMQYLVDRNEGIYWTQGRERVKFQHTIKHLYIYVNFSSLVLQKRAAILTTMYTRHFL